MSDDEAMGWIEEWAEAGVEFVSDSDLGWDLFRELWGISGSMDSAHRELRVWGVHGGERLTA